MATHNCVGHHSRTREVNQTILHLKTGMGILTSISDTLTLMLGKDSSIATVSVYQQHASKRAVLPV